MRTLPKGIKNHPSVLEADLDDDIDETRCKEGEYRADVLLKEDWHFAALDCDAPYHSDNKRRCGFFYSLKDFLAAKPTQYTAEELAATPPAETE